MKTHEYHYSHNTSRTIATLELLRTCTWERIPEVDRSHLYGDAVDVMLAPHGQVDGARW